ncbi:hypothetical protein [Bacillus horti]|uniref:Uncharacterized protein n=1 Tax=Caldalkalibacillus horti TaxID=77523 RepID=A0ABT9VU07_9BACI|nr:hypothetical protein [Bacillus horti]
MEKVKANKGSGGIDRQTIEEIIHQYGESLIEQIKIKEIALGAYASRLSFLNI